jgi:hypothetical protein
VRQCSTPSVESRACSKRLNNPLDIWWRRRECVFDPTQAGHAVTQIENEQRSIANEVRQIEQGQQIFTNTGKIATTALQAYNVAKQQYDLTHQMILAPRMLYARFLSPTSDLLLQQISNSYGNSMGWLNSANTGKGAATAYQQVSVPNTDRNSVLFAQPVMPVSSRIPNGWWATLL